MRVCQQRLPRAAVEAWRGRRVRVLWPPRRPGSLARGALRPFEFLRGSVRVFFVAVRRDGPAEAGRAAPRVRRPARGAAGRPRAEGQRRGPPVRATCRARPGRGPTAPRLPRPGEGRGEGPLPEPRPPHPGRRSPARSAPVACAEKDGRSPSPLQQLKMEDAVARESGRVSHPHKGREPSPLRPPLPAAPRGTGRRLGTSLLRVAFGVRLGSAGGGDFWAMELTHLVGGDCGVRPAWHWM